MLYTPKNTKNFMKDEKGDLAQFALILVLVVIVAIGVLQALGADIVGAFQTVVDAI
jgi:Flp pilus assembly pilin Flp